MSKEQELLTGEGHLDLFQQDGKFFLSQGEVAVDITEILDGVNHGTGKTVLNIRLSNRGKLIPATDRTEWLKSLMYPQKKEEKDGEVDGELRGDEQPATV